MARKKADPEELKQLTEVFRQHGASEPESWAKSQLEEGIPQLAIFCFATALWKGTISETNTEWIDEEIQWAKSAKGASCSQAGLALEEMLAKGVSRQAITDLVRVFQASALLHACTILDGSRVVDLPVRNWILHQLDDDGNPIAIIQGLHEILFSLDPAGREMRPRDTTEPAAATDLQPKA